MYQQIDIDIDLYRLIESNRQTFEELPRDIIKRILSTCSTSEKSPNVQGGDFTRPTNPPDRRTRRSRGTYIADIDGDLIDGGTLREILKNILIYLSKRDSYFLERLSVQSSGRRRKIVAREPSALYAGDSEFGEKHAERLDDMWWFDTNVSFEQANHYCKIMAKCTKLAAPITITK